MINSRKIFRTIQGVKFTFECVRTTTKLMSGTAYTKRWYWSYEGSNSRKTCLGGKNKIAIHNSLKYQIQAAKL